MEEENNPDAALMSLTANSIEQARHLRNLKRLVDTDVDDLTGEERQFLKDLVPPEQIGNMLEGIAEMKAQGQSLDLMQLIQLYLRDQELKEDISEDVAKVRANFQLGQSEGQSQPQKETVRRSNGGGNSDLSAPASVESESAVESEISTEIGVSDLLYKKVTDITPDEFQLLEDLVGTDRLKRIQKSVGNKAEKYFEKKKQMSPGKNFSLRKITDLLLKAALQRYVLKNFMGVESSSGLRATEPKVSEVPKQQERKVERQAEQETLSPSDELMLIASLRGEHLTRGQMDKLKRSVSPDKLKEIFNNSRNYTTNEQLQERQFREKLQQHVRAKLTRESRSRKGVSF